MRVKYFSWIKDITKTELEEISNSKIKDINSLKNFLGTKYPKLNQYLVKQDIIRIAINFKYTSTNDKISAKDEIALFPPVSGG